MEKKNFLIEMEAISLSSKKQPSYFWSIYASKNNSFPFFIYSF